MTSRVRLQAEQPAAALTRVRVSEDFDFQWVLSFLRPRAIAGVELVTPQAYARVVRVDSTPHALRLSRARTTLRVEASPRMQPGRLRALIGRMLDLDADLAAVHRQLSCDDVLGPFVSRQPGVRLLRFPDPFEAIVRAILGQQVSLAAAASTAARLTRELSHGGRERAAPRLRALPAPKVIAKASEQSLRAAGLTGAKARALQAVGRAVVQGDLNLHALATASPNEIDEELCALPGIGPWTASYVRMRGFGDRDAFPAADLGVLKALAHHLRLPRVSARDALDIAEAWRPWRGYATLHLWQSLAALH